MELTGVNMGTIGIFSYSHIDQFVCAICNDKVWGYKNNPAPLISSGYSCDKCHVKVISARLKMYPKSVKN